MARLDRLSEAAALNLELMHEITRRLSRRFLQHRASAKHRGVEFRLTFEEWRDWWLATGHVDERGKMRGQWVMARVNGRGAYEVSNLKCVGAHESQSAWVQSLREGEYR